MITFTANIEIIVLPNNFVPILIEKLQREIAPGGFNKFNIKLANNVLFRNRNKKKEVTFHFDANT